MTHTINSEKPDGYLNAVKAVGELSISALLEKLRGGVELPEAGIRQERWFYDRSGEITDRAPDFTGFTRDQLLAYGAAQRLAGRERAIEECAAECLALHANGNYKHDTRKDCHDAIRALAASPQEKK